MYNVAARRQHDLVLARRSITKEGYASIELEKTHEIEIDLEAPIMAIFKSLKQAKEFLANSAKEFRLCQKLLGLHQTKSHCFAYHLHQCSGACVGEEPPAMYNERVEQAFAGRRIKAWPFSTGVIIEERNPVTNEGEAFVIDNWCLLASHRFSEIGQTDLFRGIHRFDYDAYKIILRYISDPKNRHRIKHVPLDQLYGAAENYERMD
jgi:DNA polymerase-3 subunit epsilon